MLPNDVTPYTQSYEHLWQHRKNYQDFRFNLMNMMVDPAYDTLSPQAQIQIIYQTIQKLKFTCAPANEAEIENALFNHLQKHQLPVRRQVVLGKDRFDLVVDNIVIEAKLRGSKNVAAQLDRYSASASGLILVCWKASKPRIIYIYNATGGEI